MNHLKNCASYAALFIVLAFAGVASAQDHAPATFSAAGFGGGGFGSGAAGPIGAGDLVEMSVFDTPELSGKLRVSNTGDVILPLVGTLHLQGLKAGEAQTLIRQKLIDGGFLKDPQVTVFISEYATQNVSISARCTSPVSILRSARIDCSTISRWRKDSRPWQARPSSSRTVAIPTNRSV